MPSNETMELLENVLNENSRLKYLKMQHDKAEDVGNRMNQSSKDINRISDELSNLKPRLRNIKKARELNKKLNQAFEDNKKASEDWEDTVGIINKYSTGSEGDKTSIGDFDRTKRDIQTAGKNLKKKMNGKNKYNLYKTGEEAEKVAKSYTGKQAYMKDFGGPEADRNSIQGHITQSGNHRNYVGPYDKRMKGASTYSKEELKKRIENAKNNPRKVVGGYKLEAMYTITEALDKVLNEYEYDEDGANIVCESSCILIEALNTLLNE